MFWTTNNSGGSTGGLIISVRANRAAPPPNQATVQRRSPCLTRAHSCKPNEMLLLLWRCPAGAGYSLFAGKEVARALAKVAVDEKECTDK